VFRLTVTDNKGATGSAQVTVTVSTTAPANQPPAVSAGADTTIVFPESSLVLTGTAADADGSIAGYSWVLLSSPSSAGVNIATGSQAATVVSGLTIAGEYVFELTATDNKGATAKASVKVTVRQPQLSESSLSLYPNPATSVIRLDIKAATKSSNTIIRIFDSQGKIVYQEQFLRTVHEMVREIDISNLMSGVYFVHLEVDMNNGKTIKFIKQ
ncbi:MAG TPA: T9SS type A sorting domain-containing protein, partial [Chitinophagaceae bacterium]|nr:T9SS type A sorting domain-containing protein [Chitinophagaceae bacterium]